jgi:hypothetical protein
VQAHVVLEQPFEIVPHELPHDIGGHTQVPVESHVSPGPHGLEQLICWLQPLSTVPLHRPPHGLLRGVQHVPASGLQIPPLAHAPFWPHETGCMQLSCV